MAKQNLKNLDVNGLLALRAEIEKTLAARARDLEQQIKVLGELSQNRERPPARGGALKPDKGQENKAEVPRS